MSNLVAELAALSSSRTKYVSNLRRAFLLRTHPDRFRSQPESIRKLQAEAIHLFEDRISAQDFVEYKSPRFNHNEQHQIFENRWKHQVYHLEQKDGSLKKFTMDLNKNAENILEGIADALKTTGMSVMKPPIVPQLEGIKDIQVPNSQSILSNVRNGTGDIWNHSSFDAQRGRDLMYFVRNLNTHDIKARKASRLDANSAALVVRQLYKFQATDGTGLGWSSASLAKCLRSLAKLFDEHHKKFQIKSFYPLRLILTNDEHQEKLDQYGGTLSLNPGSTQIQWLDILMDVSEAFIRELKINRDKLHRNQEFVQNALNVKIKKGYSCPSKEYFDFLQNLSTQEILCEENDSEDSSSNAITPERVQVVVESAQVSRRATVTKTGEISVSSAMNSDLLMSSVRSLRGKAWRQRAEEMHKTSKSKELASLLQYGLGSKVFKTRYGITNDHYLSSLEALLILPEDQKAEIKDCLAGNNLGITGMGRSCHLGDDGSILIPCDWK